MSANVQAYLADIDTAARDAKLATLAQADADVAIDTAADAFASVDPEAVSADCTATSIADELRSRSTVTTAPTTTRSNPQIAGVRSDFCRNIQRSPDHRVAAPNTEPSTDQGWS